MTVRDFYKPVSKYYNLLSRVYSLGAIDRCRNGFVREMLASGGDEGAVVRVCFVGAGHGGEAIEAAERGMMVTVVDVSGSMLECLRVRLRGCNAEVRGRVRVIHDDVRNVKGCFDWVVANFFLNVFNEEEMRGMLDVLLARCDGGGSLVIGDFCYDAEGGLVRVLQWVNWYLALFVFRLFVRNAWHPVYDYVPLLSERGWQVGVRRVYGVMGLSLFESVRYRRVVVDS